MNKKKTLLSMVAATMAFSLVSINAFAASSLTKADQKGVIQPIAGSVVDADGVAYGTDTDIKTGSGYITMDTVLPKSTIYIKLDDSILTNERGIVADPQDLANDKLFSFSSDKKTNGKLVNSISLVTDKSVGNFGRQDWIKIILNDATMTTEQKFTGSVTFRAKKTADSGAPHNGFTGDVAHTGDTYKMDINLWINNQKITDGDNPGAGDRVFFEPTENDKNTLIWGDDVAALTFDANNSADKFYARLSTKADSEIYRKYGDPRNADLFFFNFVGNPSIPSTSRATLTLGIPWDLDGNYSTNPTDVYIYQVDSNGKLKDISNQFTYSEDEYDIEGWSIKTRTLGSYVISDTKLDLDQDKVKDDEVTDTKKPDKDVPNTGASDFVTVAVAVGMIALAAFAFKKKFYSSKDAV